MFPPGVPITRHAKPRVDGWMQAVGFCFLGEQCHVSPPPDRVFAAHTTVVRVILVLEAWTKYARCGKKIAVLFLAPLEALLVDRLLTGRRPCGKPSVRSTDRGEGHPHPHPSPAALAHNHCS